VQYRPKKIDYTSPASAQGGPGVSKSVTWYYGTPYINMTPAVYTDVQAATGLSLGDIWWLGDGAQASGGNAFVFAKATVGLTLGQLVAVALPTTGTATVPGAGTAASPLTTTASITTNINNAATVAVNGDVNNWIFVQATGATLPQLRRIKYNSSSTTAFYKVALPDTMRPNSPTDQDVFDTLATNGDAVSIIRPWNLIVNTATTVPVGVALGTVTAGNYTIIQVAGLACVASDGNVVDIVVNQPGVGMAGGLMTGSAAAAANLYTGASLMLPQVGLTAAGPVFIPTFVNFTGQ
jgi:hypothetical protein